MTMAQNFSSLFSPYGGYQTDKESLYDNLMLMAGLGGGAASQNLFASDGNQQPFGGKLYPEQGMRYGNTGGLLSGNQPVASGEIQNNPQVGLSPEDRAKIEARLAQTNADIIASGGTVPSLGAEAPNEGFMSRLVGRLGEQFTQPAPYTPQGGGAEAETAFGATPTQPTLFRELSELNETPLTSPDSFQTEAPIVSAPAAQIAALQSQAAPGSPQAFFEEYRSRGPLTPEQIARGEAEAARMGTTFDPETGFSRDPFLQYQQGQAPQVNRPEYGYGAAAPMSIEETRARLGGRTLNQYLNAPDGTEGVYGLRTDPQGRMISTREGEQAAGGLSDYEKASAERYARMDERKRRPGESRTQRDTRLAQGQKEQTLYGGYTEPQLRDLFGQQNLRAAKAKASAGIDPLTNERLSDERREQYDNALKTKILEERLTNYREEDPGATAFQKKRGEWRERAEDLRESGASDKEIEARRRAFLYGDTFDPYEFQQNQGTGEPTPSGEGEATDTVDAKRARLEELRKKAGK